MLFKKTVVLLLTAAFGLLAAGSVSAGPQDRAGDWLDKANAYYAAREYDQAVAALTEAIKIDPQNPSAYFFRAYIRATADKQYALAAEDFSRCIRLAPNVEAPYNERGVCYQHLGHYDLALADFTKVIELNPRSPIGYTNRGNLYAIRRDYQPASRDLEAALHLSPKSPAALFNMAQVLELTDHKSQATEYYELALKYLPQDLLAERVKAEARINGDWDSYKFWM